MTRIVRPLHLRKRPTQGRAFGESAELYRVGAGSRDQFGEFQEGPRTRSDVTLSTAPKFSRRAAEEVGVRLENTRQFTIFDLDVSPVRVGNNESSADRIRYKNVVYRVIDVRRHESIGVSVVDTYRLDPQPVVLE